MTFQVVMPKVGLTMTEGRIVEWKKKEGEWVEKGEILFVFDTEKVAFEVEAEQSGFLVKILAQGDEVVPVGEAVGFLADEKGESLEQPGKKAEAVPDDASIRLPETGAKKGNKIRATPMARRLARERGLDLENLSSSGAGGRIRMADVVEPQGAQEKLVRPSGMRRTIAERMLAAKRETAQTYMAVSVDAAGILETRERLSPGVEGTARVHLTITDILIKVTASAISSHPVMNTRWTPEGILWLDAVHIGMAMAVEDGLVVPVIRDVGRKALFEISRERAAIVEKGKAGKLLPEDLKGSTFTLSSLGMYGVEEFTAIINPPESAILAVGAILDKPVVVDKEVVVRPVMKVTLSYDHRVIDGANAAGFMKTLKASMENPAPVIS